MNIKAIDFFCGAGGVTRGLLDAGIDVVCGIDIDHTAKQTYEENNIRSNGKRSIFLERDINELRVEEIEEILKCEEPFDKLMFVGCAPCQPFTNLNTDKKKRRRERNYLLLFCDLIEYFRPDFLFIENVPGITAAKYGGILGIFKDRLEEMGYSLHDGDVNASKYGIPQNRKRRILIAAKDYKVTFPEETHDGFNVDYKTFKDVTDENKLKPLTAGEADPDDPIHRAAGLSALNLWRIQNTPHDGGGRDIWMKEKPVDCFLRHEGAYKDVYNRMYWKRPAPTMTTRFNSFSNGRFGHPEQDRAISLREGALIQTFPRRYKFFGSTPVIAKHIGNAVPVELSKTFGEYFKRISK